MNLTKPDIKRLYGSVFFKIEKGASTSAKVAPEEVQKVALEETPKVVQVETPPVAQAVAPETQTPPIDFAAQLKSGPKIQWKMRQTSQLALVLRAEEFSAPNLTAILKVCMQSAGIQSADIGFGILPDQVPPWDLTDMPVDKAVIFESEHNFPTQINLDNKNIYFATKLLNLNSEESKQQLIALLKKI